MSGHSKWSKIKRQKETNDKKKGVMFSKFSRSITLAVIEGGGVADSHHNVKLRLAIEKAKHFNMPKESIQRAIEKGSSPEALKLKEIIYEVFCPAGVALLVLVATDNQNRSYAEVKNIIESHQGKMGIQGSVSYLFKKCGTITFDKSKVLEEEVLVFGERVQAFDIDQDETTFTVYFPFEYLGRVREYVVSIETDPAEIDYKPSSIITIDDEGVAKKMFNLIEALEDLDNVQKVYANFEVSHDILSKLESMTTI